MAMMDHKAAVFLSLKVREISIHTVFKVHPPKPKSMYYLGRRCLIDNANAIPNAANRAEEAGRLITERNGELNEWGNFMQSTRGILQAIMNPFITGFEGSGIKTAIDMAAERAGCNVAQSMLAKDPTGNAVKAMQESAFTVQGLTTKAGKWASNPNQTESLELNLIPGSVF